MYLDEQEKIYHKLLSTQPSSQHWSKLAKVTLTQFMFLIVDEKGKCHKCLRPHTPPATNQTFIQILAWPSQSWKINSQYFKRIEIKGRKVPVLVTPSVQESISLPIKNWSRCGVLNENPFLFACPSAMTFFRGSDCICEFAGTCSAKNTQTLASTKLRKQIGTLSEVLNLSNRELDQLTDFLGHDIWVHHQFYCLPEGTVQLAKTSKILLALEKGCLGDLILRLNLDEINLDLKILFF